MSEQSRKDIKKANENLQEAGRYLKNAGDYAKEAGDSGLVKKIAEIHKTTTETGAEITKKLANHGD